MKAYAIAYIPYGSEDSVDWRLEPDTYDSRESAHTQVRLLDKQFLTLAHFVVEIVKVEIQL